MCKHNEYPVKCLSDANTCVGAGDFDSALHVEKVAWSKILGGRSLDDFEVTKCSKFDRKIWPAC
jgi:hypothetical protein